MQKQCWCGKVHNPPMNHFVVNWKLYELSQAGWWRWSGGPARPQKKAKVTSFNSYVHAADVAAEVARELELDTREPVASIAE